MQKFVGCAIVAFCKNLLASLAVYGCGNASRSASQTLRLFACFASDFASFICHGRIVHCSSVSCILYLVISITRIAERWRAAAEHRPPGLCARRSCTPLRGTAGSKPAGHTGCKPMFRISPPPSALRGKATTRRVIRREDRPPGCDCPMDRENRSGTAAPV